MKTEQIRALLIVASQSTDWQRRNAISIELDEACPHDEIGSNAEGVAHLANVIYHSTLSVNPALLPSMLPFFVLTCGDREDEGTISATKAFEVYLRDQSTLISDTALLSTDQLKSGDVVRYPDGKWRTFVRYGMNLNTGLTFFVAEESDGDAIIPSPSAKLWERQAK